MIISVSLADFYYWNKSFNSDFQLEYLEKVMKLDIDGVELHFSNQEIKDREYKKYVGKVKGLVVTVHLPNQPDFEHITNQLAEIQSLLNVKHFIIHADAFAGLNNNNYNLINDIDNIPVVIENCDIRKTGYQDIRDVISLGKDICLDINHTEESMPGSMVEQFEFAREKIIEMHVSSLSNPNSSDSLYDDCPHHLIYGSDFNIPSDIITGLPDDVIWVIEGIVPVGRLDLFEKEIELLRKL